MGMAFRPRPALAGAFLIILMPGQGVFGATLGTSDFEGHPVVGNQELEALRGGFEFNVGGQLLSVAFSLERVTYVNGELQALTRIVVPDLAAAIVSSPGTSAAGNAAPPGQGHDKQPVGPSIQGGAGQNAGSHVTLIQNGAGNSVVLSSPVEQQVNQTEQTSQAQILQAYNHATVIQNSLDDQVIRNMTTLNVTLSNAALARAVELNTALQNLQKAPVVVRP